MRKALKIYFFAIAIILFASVAVYASTPELPATLHGRLTINDQPAPVGTLLYADAPNIQPVIGGNPFTVREEGEYTLSVTGAARNTTVRFYVIVGGSRVYANETYVFTSAGRVTEMNLTIIAPGMPDPAIRVSGVTVTPERATINRGATQQLIAEVMPVNATDRRVSWSSDNTTVATVNANGLVTAVAAGTAAITATTADGDFKDTSTITVVVPTDPAIRVSGVTVTPERATVNRGATQQLIAEVMPVNATDRRVSWSSDNTAVATVNANGLVTAVAAGTAAITATTADGDFKDTSIITVVVPADPRETPQAPGIIPPAQQTPPRLDIVEQPIIIGQNTEIEIQGVVRLEIAAGAITGESPIITARIIPAAETAPLTAEAIEAGITLLSEIIQLSLAGGEFRAPIQLVFNFDVNKIPQGHIPGVFVYNERTGRWVYLGGQADNDSITVEVDRFSRFAVFALRPLPPFPDIAEHWGRNSIRTLAGMGVLGGYPDGSFKPDLNITRAEFVAMLTRALNLTPNPEAAGRFNDAVDFGWARGVIGAATEAGLISGYPDGSFGAARRISRAEMAVIFSRVIQMGHIRVDFGEAIEPADADAIPAWAREGILDVNRAGIIRGFQDRTFRPGNDATRAETAAMMYRLIARR